MPIRIVSTAEGRARVGNVAGGSPFDPVAAPGVPATVTLVDRPVRFPMLSLRLAVMAVIVIACLPEWTRLKSSPASRG